MITIIRLGSPREKQNEITIHRANECKDGKEKGRSEVHGCLLFGSGIDYSTYVDTFRLAKYTEKSRSSDLLWKFVLDKVFYHLYNMSDSIVTHKKRVIKQIINIIHLLFIRI